MNFDVQTSIGLGVNFWDPKTHTHSVDFFMVDWPEVHNKRCSENYLSQDVLLIKRLFSLMIWMYIQLAITEIVIPNFVKIT